MRPERATKPLLSSTSPLVCGSRFGPVRPLGSRAALATRTHQSCALAGCSALPHLLPRDVDARVVCCPALQAHRLGFVRAAHDQAGGNGRKNGNGRGLGAPAPTEQKKPSLVLSQADSASALSSLTVAFVLR
jgi:hypothetical protein